MDKQDNEIILFQNKRTFNVIAKRILILLEDLQKSHDINFDKLSNSLPEEYNELVIMSQFFDSPRFMHFRKRALDIINDGLREFSEELDKYDVSLKRL